MLKTCALTRVLTLVVALAACGKNAHDQTTTEAKVAEPGSNAVPAPGSAAVATNPAANTEAPKPAAPPAKAPDRGPEHAVYSLVDNRLAAHLTRNGGLVIPGGSAGFAKYVRFGNVMHDKKKAWELRQTEGPIKVAKLTGKTASLFVPVSAAQAQSGVIRLRAHADADGAISVKINDNKDVNGKLTAGWSTVELTVPAGQLHEGENTLTLFMHSPETELAWLQVGGTAPSATDNADGGVAFYDANAKALLLPKDGAMSWYVSMPDKAKLTADLSDGTCGVSVLATADDGTTAEGKLAGIGSAVDLGALAGKAVRLDLDGTGCPLTAITNAALVVPGAAAEVKRGAPPKYVVFVIMDALRADRIKQFNPKARPDTPNWDKLADNSTLFENTYVQGNESQVSHASIWSSNYLIKHKAIEMKDHLDSKWLTIDGVAKAAHMYVAGASGNGYIRPARGFGHSWDQFVNHIEKELGLRGGDIMDKGFGFVANKKDPWFLYLGLIDTHVTWRAKEPWMSKYDGGYKGRFADAYGDDGKGASNGKDLTDREKDHVRALYDSNVSYQDDLIGQIVSKLQAAGIWDQTMLIVTADHGDEQWEDGRVGHGGSERETLLHVPLMIHYPPLFPAGKVTEGVEDIDITPTLADALGVPTDPEWQGMSLIPVANGVGGGYPWMSFSSMYENGHAGRIGHWKLRLAGSGTPHLYDLAADPGEKSDLWGEPKSEIGARLLLDPMWIMRQWNLEWKQSQWGNAADVSSRFASDLGE